MLSKKYEAMETLKRLLNNELERKHAQITDMDQQWKKEIGGGERLKIIKLSKRFPENSKGFSKDVNVFSEKALSVLWDTRG